MLTKVIIAVIVIALLVGLCVCVLRKLVKHSAPLALACAIVLTVFIAPVWAAHTIAVLVVAGMFYIVIT